MLASGPLFGGTTGQLELDASRYHCFKASVNNAEPAHSLGFTGRAPRFVSQRRIAISKSLSDANVNAPTANWFGAERCCCASPRGPAPSPSPLAANEAPSHNDDICKRSPT